MTVIQNQIGATTSRGTISMANAWTGATFSLTTSYQEMTGLSTAFTLLASGQDFSMTTDGRLKYTGIQTRNFIINGTFSDGTSATTAIAAYKNGTLITGGESYGNNNVFQLVNVPVQLVTNDYVSMFVKKGSAGSVTIYQILLSAESVI